MSLPKIEVVFKSKAESMIKRGERGVIALLLEDLKEDVYTIKSITDIPKDLNSENINFIKDAYKGGDTPPSEIYAVTYTDLVEGLKILETIDFQYGAVPGINEEDVEVVSTWTKEAIDKKDLTFQMVLPNSASNHHGIINFTTTDITLKNGEEVTTSEFTARIAGLLGGIPLTKSSTFAILDDVESVERISTDEADERVKEGEFILINENNKVKVGRGVTSLTTVKENQSNQWKKILIVQKMFMWKDDVESTISDYYVGKFSNTYDHKCLLLTDIRLYNKQLERLGILDDSDLSYNNVYIDLEKQESFLEEIGELKEGMSVDDVKKANTRDKVFINTNLKFTDAMEDFEVSAMI